MINEQRRKTDRKSWIEKWGILVGAILGTGALISLCWGMGLRYLDPHVKALIDEKQKPILEEIHKNYESSRFNSSCFKALMSEDAMKKAEEIYRFDKECRGVK